MNEDKNNFLFSLRFRWTRKNYEKFYCLIWKKGKVIPIGYLKIYKCKIYILEIILRLALGKYVNSF